MEKFVLLSDIHLGLNYNSNFWLDLTGKLFDEINDVCDSREITNVILLGDFFDNRKNINVLTLNKAIEIQNKFKERGNFLQILKGNHDQYYKNMPTPHSLEFLKDREGVYVIDEIEEFYDWYIVPWGADISEIPDNSKVMGHFEINGFPTNYTNTILTKSKYNTSDFKRFDTVLSGHFHKRSKIANIEYIGSAFPINFNDINAKRGYYIFENGEREFIEFTKAPKFKSFTSEDEITDEIEGNMIRFTFVKDYGNVKNEKLIQSVYSKKPLKLHVDYKIDADNSELTIDEENMTVQDNSQIFMEYIDNYKIPDHINRKGIKNLVKEMEKEI